jgi:hypothetical protein
MTGNLEEVPPLGGNSGTKVVRIGDTVRRPATPYSANVDALLQHFVNEGVVGVPTPLGYDDQGRQVVSFVEGHVSDDPRDLDESRLMELGQLIRRLHDVAVTFTPPTDAKWNVLITPDAEDIICHQDLAPWNLVRTSTRLTFIDWEGAGPGSRLWDLAYAAHGFVPFSPEAFLSDDIAGQRLWALVEGYGLCEDERARLVNILGPRVRSVYDNLKNCHENGIEPWSRHWEEGHGAIWLAHAIYTENKRDVWATVLLR